MIRPDSGAIVTAGAIRGASDGRALAVQHVARHHAEGLRSHDLRHSSATTLDLDTRRTDNSDLILQALDDSVDPDAETRATPSRQPKAG